MFSSLDKFIPNLLHNESREFDDPGNFFLATSKESIISVFWILGLLILNNSLSKKFRSKGALWIMIFFSLIKLKNSSEICENVGFVDKKSSENPWTLKASSETFFLDL